MIRKKIYHLLGQLPDEELEHVYWSIESIYQEYRHKKNLLNKGVVISEIIEDANVLIDKWDKSFANSISEKEREEIHYDDFKWHIFSYEKQSCLLEEEARKAFTAMTKDEVYVMYEGAPFIFLYSNSSKLVAEDFDTQDDIYIFDKNFTWTYVRTHESLCGPYFYRVNEMTDEKTQGDKP
ncbi:DUF4275 family protein [Bacillus suaedaesalsae]|uniref:DUF4275 family protein n=1 Tax=Bacillus suaedaesalsae TaxID=2810349 RepID=A0ABS2DPI7_9BACI|nr:DUF4275 family protein [Bacillus suaedaesalsae]MBM6619603.1 DUF4275 family protein [Bacillus suaedaesalsae]